METPCPQILSAWQKKEGEEKFQADRNKPFVWNSDQNTWKWFEQEAVILLTVSKGSVPG